MPTEPTPPVESSDPAASPRSPSAEEAMPEGPEPPPRGTRGMAALRWGLLAAAALLAIFAWWSLGSSGHGAARGVESGESAPRYRCPMHPQIVSDVPGECPICHMTLEPIADHARGPAPLPPAARDAGLALDAEAGSFTCPMHPEVRASAPGACPVCGMRLVPVARDAGVDSHAPSARAGEAPPGTAPVTLALDRIQSIGVRTAPVEARATAAALRVTAVVAPADDAVAEVHARTSGFVERIPVGEIGARVKAGQELLAMYSPELYQAQAELLATRKWGDARGDGSGDAGSRAVDSGRRKLELLGMAPRDVDRVIATGEPLRAVPVYAPRAGVVTRKGAVAGGYVTPDAVLYEILDLSRVYVVADVFQKDVAQVRVGMPARFTPRQRETAVVEGKVDLVYPAVGAESRTTRVRLTVQNGAGLLRPGDYGEVTIATGGTGPAATRALVVPRDAVIDTGTSTYVFVAGEAGRFTPRVVVLGEADGAMVVVREGLVAGERVVSGATFLVDSESRLEASLAESAATGSSP